ncbi:hypothetical protein MMC25_001523 [Agyrium rufum]|nr:hypothetical protein [Agyrium rufum]
MSPSTIPFRVIVVGSGVSGLIMAHALQHAGIDYIVLEAHREVVHSAGSSFGLWPSAARILDQLGCWQDIKNVSTPITHHCVRRPNGSVLVHSKIFTDISANFGYEALVVERPTLLRILYEHISDKSRIQTARAVDHISETTDGLEVSLKDGTTERGDIVVGCDGVHSTVRKCMWDIAKKAAPTSFAVLDGNGLSSSFHCLVGVSPSIQGIRCSESNSVQRQGFSIQVTSQPESTFFFTCIKPDASIDQPDRKKFTPEALEEQAAKLTGITVTETVFFGDIWKQRHRGYMCLLEEGLQERWHHGRCVLVGDSAHKMSPVLALGGTCAIESAAALVNYLYEGICLHPERKPHGETLIKILETYQAAREPRVTAIYQTVSKLTRIQTTDGHLKRFISRFVLPFTGLEARTAIALTRGAVKIEFLPVPERRRGITGFDDDNMMPQVIGSKDFLRASRAFSGLVTKYISLRGFILMTQVKRRFGVLDKSAVV